MDSPSSQPSTPYLTFSTSSASPAHRRPILATSSSFGRQLDSPRRSATATRATSPRGGEIGSWSDLHRPQPTSSSSSSSISSSEGSSPDRSKKETRMTGKTVHNASRPPPASLARGQAGRPSSPSLLPSGKKTSSLRWLEGLDRYLSTIGGRDQVFKLVQYVLRLVIFLRRFRARGDASSTGGRTERVMDNISFARRSFYAFTPLAPLLKLSRPPQSLASIIPTSLDALSGLTDDVWTLYKFGAVGRKTAFRAAKWGNRLWMYYIILSLSHLSLSTPRLSKRIAAAEAMDYELDDRRMHLVSEKGGEDDVRILKRRRKVEVWKALKLWLDLVYVSYDVFHLSPYKDVVQMLTGLGASGISVLNGVETQRLDDLKKGL